MEIPHSRGISEKRSTGKTPHEEPDDLYDGYEIIEDDEEDYLIYQDFYENIEDNEDDDYVTRMNKRRYSVPLFLERICEDLSQLEENGNLKKDTKKLDGGSK